jgi:hypothetical protein
MSRLMMIAGILLAAVAVALVVSIFFSPASVVAWGINIETASILLVGGVLAAGLGGVIAALEERREEAVPLTVPAQRVAAPEETAIPQFGRKATEAAPPEVSPAVGETIRALEQAKSDIRQALGEEPKPEPEPVAESPAPEEMPVEEPTGEDVQPTEEESVVAAPEEGQLYVVEERIIRERQARLLSDGTVEAETDEGWMRFENLEHLDEYLDAMSPAGRA